MISGPFHVVYLISFKFDTLDIDVVVDAAPLFRIICLSTTEALSSLIIINKRDGDT